MSLYVFQFPLVNVNAMVRRRLADKLWLFVGYRTDTQIYFSCSGSLIRRLTHAQHPLLSEQFLRMPQARRWFQHSQGGGQGCLHGPVRGSFVGMSQAVWPFPGPDFGCLPQFSEDVSAKTLVLGSWLFFLTRTFLGRLS